MWELFVVVVQDSKICRFLDSLHIILSLSRGTLEEKCRRPSSSNSQLPKWLTSANDESRVSFPIYSRSSGPRSLASEGSGVLAPGVGCRPCEGGLDNALFHFSALCRRECRRCNWMLVRETLFTIFYVHQVVQFHQLHR